MGCLSDVRRVGLLSLPSNGLPGISPLPFLPPLPSFYLFSLACMTRDTHAMVLTFLYSRLYDPRLDIYILF